MIMSLEDLPKLVHIHELERSKSNKTIYRCTHPRCSYYQKREYLEGKECICFKCKQVFILTWVQLRNKKPVCIYCSKSPKAKELKELRELSTKALSELGQDLPEELKEVLNQSMQEVNKEEDEING